MIDNQAMLNAAFRSSSPPVIGPQFGIERIREDLAAAQRSFSSVLGKATGAAEAGESPESRAREAAQQLVAHTFVVPMLKELRASDHSAPPFAPSQGEKQFRALMDAELAQRIVKASRFGLVDRLARDLLKASSPATEAPDIPHAAPTARGGSTP